MGGHPCGEVIARAAEAFDVVSTDELLEAGSPNVERAVCACPP